MTRTYTLIAIIALGVLVGAGLYAITPHVHAAFNKNAAVDAVAVTGSEEKDLSEGAPDPNSNLNGTPPAEAPLAVSHESALQNAALRSDSMQSPIWQNATGPNGSPQIAASQGVPVIEAPAAGSQNAPVSPNPAGTYPSSFVPASVHGVSVPGVGSQSVSNNQSALHKQYAGSPSNQSEPSHSVDQNPHSVFPPPAEPMGSTQSSGSEPSSSSSLQTNAVEPHVVNNSVGKRNYQVPVKSEDGVRMMTVVSR